MRRFILAASLALLIAPAAAQSPLPGGPTNQSSLALTAPTPPNGDNSNRVATTAFVLSNAGGFPTPTRAGDVIYWSGSAWVTLAGNNSGSNCFGENAAGLPSWMTCSGGSGITQLTGDVTAGPGSGSQAATLASVITAAGPIGSATVAPIITYDAKGRLTTVTSATVTPAIGSITGLGTGCATWLATATSANLRACITDETGTGLAYFQGGDIGTPSAGVGTNITGTAAGLTAGTATNAVNSGITNDTTTNATMFPLWVTANTGNLPVKVTSTKLSFNPSTGLFTSTGFAGSGASLTGVPLTGLASQAANTLVANATAGSAAPTAVDISLLTTKASPTGSDWLLLSDQAASGALKKVAFPTGGVTFANPTATASDTAVNGVATTAMRSDGAPAVQKASNAQFGVMEGDGSTITCTTGVCSATTTAWGSYSPTLSCGTGSLTTSSATGAFKQIGKTVFYRFVISITTNGSCAASLRITLPVAPLSGVDMMTPVRDVGTSVVGAGRINSGLGNLLLITLYNGGYLGGDAASIVGTGVYEAN